MLGKHFTIELMPVLPVLTVLSLITSFTYIHVNVKFKGPGLPSPPGCYVGQWTWPECHLLTCPGVKASSNILGILEALHTYPLILIVSCLFQSQNKT